MYVVSLGKLFLVREREWCWMLADAEETPPSSVGEVTGDTESCSDPLRVLSVADGPDVLPWTLLDTDAGISRAGGMAV